MNMTIKAAAATAGLLTALALPLGAGAAQTGDPQQYTFNTAIRNDHQAGEVDGQMRLRITPDGIVQGEYRDYDQGTFRTVTGGLHGDQIWLAIGGVEQFHVSGTLRDGVLRTVVRTPGIDLVTLNSVNPAH